MNTENNIWSRSSSVEKRTYHTTIEFLAYLTTYFFLLQNASRMHWSLSRSTFHHIELLKKFFCILTLVYVCSFWALINLYPQKELEFSHYTHFKFCLH